jgi:hypothetical protein
MGLRIVAASMRVCRRSTCTWRSAIFAWAACWSRAASCFCSWSWSSFSSRDAVSEARLFFAVSSSLWRAPLMVTSFCTRSTSAWALWMSIPIDAISRAFRSRSIRLEAAVFSALRFASAKLDCTSWREFFKAGTSMRAMTCPLVTVAPSATASIAEYPSSGLGRLICTGIATMPLAWVERTSAAFRTVAVSQL